VLPPRTYGFGTPEVRSLLIHRQERVVVVARVGQAAQSLRTISACRPTPEWEPEAACASPPTAGMCTPPKSSGG